MKIIQLIFFGLFVLMFTCCKDSKYNENEIRVIKTYKLILENLSNGSIDKASKHTLYPAEYKKINSGYLKTIGKKQFEKNYKHIVKELNILKVLSKGNSYLLIVGKTPDKSSASGFVIKDEKVLLDDNLSSPDMDELIHQFLKFRNP
jgi:hypothetical protein